MPVQYIEMGHDRPIRNHSIHVNLPSLFDIISNVELKQRNQRQSVITTFHGVTSHWSYIVSEWSVVLPRFGRPICGRNLFDFLWPMKEPKFTNVLLTIKVCNYGDIVAGTTGQDYQCKTRRLCPRWILFSLFLYCLRLIGLKLYVFLQPPFMFCYFGPFKEIYYRISNLRGWP